MLATFAHQLAPGMTIQLEGQILQLEQITKVTLAKGPPFYKAILRDPITQEVVERNLRPDQNVEEVKISKRRLEFLYFEGSESLFLDVDTLEQVLVPQEVVKEKSLFLKEGVEVRALVYGSKVFSIELPQFLEFLIIQVKDPMGGLVGGTKKATLETNAEIDVPIFIEVGDIIKVDTGLYQYVQRV